VTSSAFDAPGSITREDNPQCRPECPNIWQEKHWAGFFDLKASSFMAMKKRKVSLYICLLERVAASMTMWRGNLRVPLPVAYTGEVLGLNFHMGNSTFIYI